MGDKHNSSSRSPSPSDATASPSGTTQASEPMIHDLIRKEVLAAVAATLAALTAMSAAGELHRARGRDPACCYAYLLLTFCITFSNPQLTGWGTVDPASGARLRAYLKVADGCRLSRSLFRSTTYSYTSPPRPCPPTQAPPGQLPPQYQPHYLSPSLPFP